MDYRRIGALVLLLSLAAGCDDGNSSPTTPTEPTDPCTVYPEQNSSPYVLPYPIGQGYPVSFTTGHAPVLAYAVDFDMPIGTPILAAREGTVADLGKSFVDGDRGERENFVLIEHPDGTAARYVHLTHDGALVEIGQGVNQGQVIGLSGDTGRSLGPHLHFDVTQCCCVSPPTVTNPPCDRTIPLTFRNTRPHACGVVLGEVYIAETY